MNTITPRGGIVGSVVPFLIPRIQDYRSNEPGWFDAERAWEVDRAAVNSAVWLGGIRHTTAATRLSYERLSHIAKLRRGRARGFPLSKNELEGIAHVEQLVGKGHPDAARELTRFDALPCEPYADEVAWGLFTALRWLVAPTNIRQFGFSHDQGLYL